MKKFLLFVLLTGFIFVTQALGSVIETPGVAQWNLVSGSDMAGIQVSVNGGTAKTWASTGANSGSAGETGLWSLSYSGDDTYYGNWSFEVLGQTPIHTLTIDAGSADVFFDVLPHMETLGTTGSIDHTLWSTNGSVNGWYQFIGGMADPSVIFDGKATATFDDDEIKGNQNGAFIAGTSTIANSMITPDPNYSGPDFEWTFSNPVALTGQDPKLDLWGTLTLNFGPNGLLSDSLVNFRVDTDLDGSREVPEPSAILLFGLGLLGMGAIGRKKS